MIYYNVTVMSSLTVIYFHVLVYSSYAVTLPRTYYSYYLRELSVFPEARPLHRLHRELIKIHTE